MSWHRLWHQQEDATRPEAPSSKLRRAMRKQMRDDAKRVVVPPEGAYRDPLTRPPNPHIPEEPLEVDPPILPADFWYVDEGCE